MKEKKVIHNGKEYIFDEKAGKWKTLAENGQVSWALDSLGKTLTGKLDASIAQPNGKTKNVSYLGKTYTVPLSDFDTKNHTVQLKEFDAQFSKGGIKEEYPTILKWDEKTKTWTADHNSAYEPAKTEVKVQEDNKTVTGDTPPEGARVKHSTGTYVYTGGKWRHKSGDGYDFSANATNEKLLNEKVKNGDYEVWDNKANGYVEGQPLKQRSLKEMSERTKIEPLNSLSGKSDRVSNPPDAEKVIEEKAVAGTGLTGGSAKTALAKTDKAVREAQTEAGITPLKGNLTSPDNATPLAKASMADYFDMDAALAYNKMTPVKEGLNMDKLSSFSEYLPDVFKGALGLYGASQKLPEFETPQYFTDYERKLKELSTQGLTAEEMATAKRDLERTYAYDVNNIERFAGGRSGVALANLGRATNTYQGNTNALNVADAQMQRQNLAQYGGVVGTHLGLDQNAFNQKYQEAAQSKLAGAQLAADAFSNIQSRSDYNKAYGKGSVYDKYQTSLLQGQEYLNDIYKYQLDNPVPLPEYNPIIAPPTIPQYQNQYTNPNG